MSGAERTNEGEPGSIVVDTGTWWARLYCRHQTLCSSMPAERCSVDEVPVDIGGAA